MIRKKKQVTLVVAILLFTSMVFAFIRHQKHKDDLLPVTLQPIQTHSGWGYEIFVGGKMFIRQEALPAVTGYKSFRNKQEALAVGNLAVKKLVSGKVPAITIDDLKLLKVVE